MNKPVLDAQTLQNLAEGDRAVISGFQGTIQVGYGRVSPCGSSLGSGLLKGPADPCGAQFSQWFLWIFSIS